METDVKTEALRIIARYPIVQYNLEEVKCAHLRLLELSGAERIVIQGSTPSWNDGDVCRHREHVFDEPTMCDHYGVVSPDDPNRTDDDETLDDCSCGTPARGEANPDILDAICDMGHVRTNLFNTNYEIVLTKNPDGSLSWSNEEWNPEW